MDVAVVKAVIERLREPDVLYDQDYWFVSPGDEKFYGGAACGTPLCICGHAIVVKGWEVHPPSPPDMAWYVTVPNTDNFVPASGMSVRDAGRLALDIDIYDADQLFDGEPIYHFAVTREHAIAVLEHLIETGNVDWDAAVQSVETEWAR